MDGEGGVFVRGTVVQGGIELEVWCVEWLGKWVVDGGDEGELLGYLTVGDSSEGAVDGMCFRMDGRIGGKGVGGRLRAAV